MYKKKIPKLFFSNYDEVINKKKNKKYKFFAFFPFIICFSTLAFPMIYLTEYIRESVVKEPFVFEKWIIYAAMAISFCLILILFCCVKDNFKSLFKTFILIATKSIAITYLLCILMSSSILLQFAIVVFSWMVTLYFFFVAITDEKKFNGDFLVAEGLLCLNIMLDRDLLCFFNQILDFFWKGG